MSSTWGNNIRLNLFGQSHSAAIGMTLEGLPAGLKINEDKLHYFLARRAPGHFFGATVRKESDYPEFISGLFNGRTCGVPLTAIIRNQDARPEDYESIKDTPRPGHADYTASIKYHGFQDYRGGGHFSGRLTAPLCIAGGCCKQWLEEQNIQIITRVYAIGGIEDTGILKEDLSAKNFPVIDDIRGKAMLQKIKAAMESGDSVGGIIECAVFNLPAGLGDPIFNGMESRIAGLVFGIPAVKGIEFGEGFSVAAMNGSENNDAFMMYNGQISTESNHCGGILGGITNGMPLIFKTAFKPTPSIDLLQSTVDLKSRQETFIHVKGRHDTCIVLRALPCIESAAALAVYDALLERKMQ